MESRSILYTLKIKWSVITKFKISPSHNGRIFVGELIGGGTGWWQANGRNVFGVIDGRVNRQDGNVILL